MINNRLLSRIAVLLFMFSAPALSRAQIPGGAILGGVVKGVKQSNEVSKKVSQQLLKDLLQSGVARIPINPSVEPPFKVDTVLTILDRMKLVKLSDLPRNLKLPDTFNVSVYLDCLVIQDDALWDNKVSMLCSRLVARYPKTNEEQWREYLDTGRLQGNRRLQLAPELRKYWLDYLVGEGEEQFGEEDGLYWYRLEESSMDPSPWNIDLQIENSKESMPAAG